MNRPATPKPPPKQVTLPLPIMKMMMIKVVMMMMMIIPSRIYEAYMRTKMVPEGFDLLQWMMAVEMVMKSVWQTGQQQHQQQHVREDLRLQSVKSSTIWIKIVFRHLFSRPL